MIANPKSKKQKKAKFVISGYTVFIALLVFFALFIFSPIPQFIITRIPNEIVETLFQNTIQNIILDDKEETLDQPKKYTHTKPLRMLGRNTGLCFRFSSTPQNENKKSIDAKRLKRAQMNGEAIAEIIIIGNDQNEYKLTDVTVDISQNKQKQTFSYLCQKFGNEYSSYPDEITAIYIRPLRPFTPSQVIWTTAIDIYY
ncbi:MAG: hypothetical protein ACRBCK_07400 [Alphaproteobacteria bacterium]